jgi:hypothetical protein
MLVTCAGAAECRLDKSCLFGAGLVVGVYERGLEVAMAHPLLDRPHLYAGRRHPRADGVAQVAIRQRAELGPYDPGSRSPQNVDRVTDQQVTESGDANGGRSA